MAYNENRVADLGKVMVEVEDVMTAQDVVDCVNNRINRYSKPGGLTFTEGPRLERAIRKVADEVREFHTTQSSWVAPDESQWLALGLYWVSSEMVDLCPNNHIKLLNRAQLIERLDQLIAESLEEADEEYPSPWDEEEQDIARAWLNASPYTVWKLYQEAREKAEDWLTDNLFDMASGNTSGKSLVNMVSDTYAEAVGTWRQNYIKNRGENAA